ncbi:uncharacterized protein LOC120277979 [Dioscorea cayenensis subsp. rotundata]|uniref:Uncharacterized protein LOC120277979 n=1 Tax=Dioscorea cayennensis subsp. rotundata TaxID=55577 RepID=A0AB40CQF6_DIOCR|nr:uncharacterized protein LOC120277979 [Dioscorea cayenensis subsp. rotundata]
MGFVVVISLPLIIFAIILGFGCYFLGRAKGRQDMRTGVGAQVYGSPTPPQGITGPEPHSSSTVTQIHTKEGPDNV